MKNEKNFKYSYNNITLPNYVSSKKVNKNLNKYGLLMLQHLKENKKSLYQILLMKDELNEYLYKVGIETEKKINKLLQDFIERDKELNEELKEKNQLKWIQLMNNYKNCAEEIALKEHIYF